MRIDMQRRLVELERRVEKRAATRDSDGPKRIYQAAIYLGHEAPEPQSGEDTKAYLTRVPMTTLRALIDYRNAHADHPTP